MIDPLTTSVPVNGAAISGNSDAQSLILLLLIIFSLMAFDLYLAVRLHLEKRRADKQASTEAQTP